MGYVRKDAFYRKAKREGERSRAAYKIEELNRRFALFRRGDRVLDLGAFPGGWSQVAARAVGPGGRVVGVDLVPIEPLPEKNAVFLEGDLTDPATIERVLSALGGPVRCVLSDASPKLSGIRDADAARSRALVEAVVAFTLAVLPAGGNLACKVFSEAGPEELRKTLEGHFERVRLFRPEATRKESSEIYLVATGRRENPPELTAEPRDR